MAIAKAFQRDSYVYVHDPSGAQLCTIAILSTAPEDGLKEFTPSTVTFRRMGYIYKYDERGQQIGVPTPVS